MADRLRLRLQGADGTVYGDIDPPPTKTKDFIEIWKRWIFNLYAYLAGINDLITVNQTIEDWTALSLQNSWIDAGTDPAYYIDRGRVYLKGTISTGTSGTVAFTLPTGYRPPQAVSFPLLQSGATAGAYLVVNTDGTTNVFRTGAAVELNNVSFRV